MRLTSLKKRLGDILVDVGIITKEQLDKALETQRMTGEKLGAILAQMGVINEEVMLAFLGKQCGVSYVSINEYGEIPADVVRSIPESVARQQILIPLAKEANTITIAMADPFNVFAIDDIKVMTGLDVNIVIASESEIKEAIEKYYSHTLEFKHTVADLIKSAKDISDEELVSSILSEAVKSKASDIHMQPQADSLHIRFRIDGILHDYSTLGLNEYKNILNRLKKMANLNIDINQYLPRGSKIKIRVDGNDIDLRISIIPTVTGQKLTLQILSNETLCRDLAKLGFETETLAAYKKNIESKSGLIIISSPIYSGKTTTLYSTVGHLNHPDRNILTIEDPVKYIIPGITQVQVDTDNGMTASRVLRSFEMQNPDIIVVDEVRDPETARQCINAALTGHLVFATFPINDSAGVLVHLKNMGIEPFMIATSLRMVLAQRLMRAICPDCRESYDIPTNNVRNIGIDPKFANDQSKIELWRGKGCSSCNFSGYRGRVAIYEILELNSKLRELILDDVQESLLRQLVTDMGVITLREAAWRKVRTGVSTAEEMLRLTKYT
ncbi:MAG: Flp pilus assembly complex ATPase component TadA [Elusimicrobia bacterium]|nr:Flp pilus assembly complex ATPase component TadA [Candidatus Liberimonas magnetica]